MKRLLILSGKGGTGKTTVAGAFIQLSNAKAFADCDVDAPNLHLIMEQKAEPFKSDYYGMGKAKITTEKCTSCGLCENNCRFKAISLDNGCYIVDTFSCEGCGVCEAICPNSAISLMPSVAGELMLYKGRVIFSNATLKMGSGTSGKLVTQVKKQLNTTENVAQLAIIDGSPGIGCPVIASLSGVDMVLIVAEPSLSGISDMERIIKTAQKFGVKTIVCVNKYDTNIENTIKIEKLCYKLQLPFVGRIPFDSNVVATLNKGRSITDIDCGATKAIKSVYQKTINILKEQ
jgi:MinD superfamily P-loop ATPase